MLPSVHNKGAAASTGESSYAGGKISSNSFYGNYHGQIVEHLKIVREGLVSQGKKSLVYLMGDSSLDNKYWLLHDRLVPNPIYAIKHFLIETMVSACNGYENILHPSKSVADVAYWMNLELAEKAPAAACINASVEESTIASRDDRLLPSKRAALGECIVTITCSLLPQDAFVQANITSEDVIIISLGGNDIALRPSFKTICSMGWLAKCSWGSSISSGSAWGMDHLRHLFRDRILEILQNICSASKPKAILVCMIYFPDITGRGGWADTLLKLLGYDSNPGRLHSLIRTAFQQATSDIKLEGTLIIPTPLFEVLDGQVTDDYVQRVEPSAQGGKKMAGLFMKLMQQHEVLPAHGDTSSRH